MKRLTIEKMHELAEERNGKCLSTKYKNAHTKLRWECSLKHEWDARPYHISQGKWCPYCKSGKNEERCRFIFEQLTGFVFLKTRSIINGELDGFCKHLNLAFEYQGIQHYKEVPFFKSNLDSIKSKDAAKKKECKQKNINLIEIPYLVAESETNELEKYIRNHISEYIIPNIEVNYGKEKSSLINRINKLRSKDFLTCIGIDRIVGGNVYVKMKCKMSHEWVVLAHSITHMGRGCSTCLGRNRTIDDVKIIATDRGGECLSEIYINVITKMKWRCSMKHEWMANLNKILCGRWCPECAKKSRIENRRLNKGWSYEMIYQLYITGMSIKDICSKLDICSVTTKRAINEMNNYAD